MTSLELVERQRISEQDRLDSEKDHRDHSERNRLGQFATPTALALDILSFANDLISPRRKISFLDPAFGTGSFYSALLRTVPTTRIERAFGFEIDPHYGNKASELWGNTKLRLTLKDFTKQAPPSQNRDRASLLICNPPYVRHHHLASDDKLRLQQLVLKMTGIRFSGLAGLYCYFLCLSQAWMTSGGLAAWLMPSEFMDVNYGDEVKRFLLQNVTLLRVHRFDPADVQFGDALVSSAVVWFRNERPSANHMVDFTFGGTHRKPKVSKRINASDLATATKWTRFPTATTRVVPREAVRVGELFTVKRGIATGANQFFIVTEEQAKQYRLPSAFLRPILPSPRHLPVDEVHADRNGIPLLDRRLFLIDCRLPEDVLKTNHPALWTYLQRGHELGIVDKYLCENRSPWYLQEQREPAPIACTYMGRTEDATKSPFRFIRNRSKATAANVYLLLYPKPLFQLAAQRDPSLYDVTWRALNAIPAEFLTSEGRVYGGGLHKMEPRELANAEVPGIDRSIVGIPFQPDLALA